jgi:16S rRNA (guanine527-N7)-methyltransferase
MSPAAIDAVIGRQPWDELRALLAEVGAPDVGGAVDHLRAYTRLVVEWNRGVSNIVSRNDEQRFVQRHLMESIAPARQMRESGATSWVDFGSGAGLPAVPLSIAGVGDRWKLVESRRSKTLFIRKTIQVIVLHGFEVVNDRLENVVSDPSVVRDRDGFTSRATMAIGPTLALAAPLIRAGGCAFLWKGSGAEGEMKADSTWRDAWEFSTLIPVGRGPSVVAIFTRNQ